MCKYALPFLFYKCGGNKMDLSTSYLGLKLKNPVVPAASPLSQDLGMVKKLEDQGAAAIVMYSLFEEQINHEANEIDTFLMQGADSTPEAMSYFPVPEAFHNMHAEDYLENVAKIKKAVDIPVIGSLNGVSAGGWVKFAKKIEEAGADALELNIYYLATNPAMSAEDVEKMYLDSLRAVKKEVSIPVAIKTGPYFSAFANMAKKFEENGADGIVVFNRFYQPDINLESLKVEATLQYSTSYESRLPVRWIAILRPFIKASLAATSGFHNGDDVIKALLAGADVAMMASALLSSGCEKVKSVLDEIEEWMEKHEYGSVNQLKGSMSYKSVAEPAAYERANYMKTLQSVR